ncbi:uncharacterized protein LOC143244496 isoform X2 [Tachypleus tridentatus]|uniref:uncharacterized protein LOC143244496 isoform X2 n=1 Tax=Tachypleus tridentatus TaxID=6853 RepID=UPI003FD3338E
MDHRVKENKYDISGEKILRSPRSAIKIPDMTFPEFMYHYLEKNGDKRLLVAYDNSSSYTYEEVAFYSRRFASALIRQGLKSGDVFCICVTNNINFPIAVLGAVSAGAVIVLGKPYETENELRYTLESTNAVYILAEKEMIEKIRNSTQNLVNFKDIFVFGKAEGCFNFYDIIHDDDGLTYIGPPKINPKEAPLILTFTSGTTGLPKAIVHTHHGIIASIMQLTHPTSLKLSLEDIVLSTYPFCHLGTFIILCSIIKCNASFIVIPYYDFDMVLKSIPYHKPKLVFAIVAFVYKLLMDPKVQDYDLTSIKEIITGAAPLNWKANEEVIMKKFPCLESVRQLYGLSELVPVSIVEEGSVLPNSVGKLVSSTELKVIDTITCVDLGPNQCGEIYVRGEQLMKGYLNNPKLTSEAITTSGWLVTGDYGYYDLEGNLYITDRMKEMIKTEFHQVSPIEIESLLCSHPAVSDAAVIGIVDSSMEEVPRGYVVLKQGYKVEPIELIQFVSDRVSHPKQLRGGLEVLDKIPRSEMGKIQRRTLQKYYYQNNKIHQVFYLKKFSLAVPCCYYHDNYEYSCAGSQLHFIHYCLVIFHF